MIPDAKLWGAISGNTVSVYGKAVTFGDDYCEEPFGVRTVRVEGLISINGKPFYFKGFGKHEDSAFHGRGWMSVWMLKMSI